MDFEAPERTAHAAMIPSYTGTVVSLFVKIARRGSRIGHGFRGFGGYR